MPQSSPHQSGPNSGSTAFIPSLTTSNSFAASTPGPPSLTPVPTPASSKEQMPALQRLKEYAAMSGAHGTAPLQQFFPGSSADPSLPNRILSGQYGSFEKEKYVRCLKIDRFEHFQANFHHYATFSGLNLKSANDIKKNYSRSFTAKNFVHRFRQGIFRFFRWVPTSDSRASTPASGWPPNRTVTLRR